MLRIRYELRDSNDNRRDRHADCVMINVQHYQKWSRNAAILGLSKPTSFVEKQFRFGSRTRKTHTHHGSLLSGTPTLLYRSELVGSSGLGKPTI